ncbi:MAG: hypothetical protein PHY93_09400 [Bacteriovorax sp.]|nr:hypothetical protein [Bacteriovorax sp.]
MNKRLSAIKEKVKSFINKSLKNKKDANLNAHIKDEVEYRKMQENMKMY